MAHSAVWPLAMVAQKGLAKVPALVVPGSVSVQQQAQAEGLDEIIKQAGFERARPGCSVVATAHRPHLTSKEN